MYSECMVDIESLSTRSNAVVLSIGAVLFDLDEQDTYETLAEDGRCFFALLDIDEQIAAGRHISGSTLMWWMRQNSMAKKETFNEKGRQPVDNVLKSLWPFLAKANMWGNGANFDNPIIASLYEDYGYDPPPFWQARDLRTLKYVSSDSAEHIERGVEHSAIEDAQYQVLCAQAHWNGLQT